MLLIEGGVTQCGFVLLIIKLEAFWIVTPFCNVVAIRHSCCYPEMLDIDYRNKIENLWKAFIKHGKTTRMTKSNRCRGLPTKSMCSPGSCYSKSNFFTSLKLFRSCHPPKQWKSHGMPSIKLVYQDQFNILYLELPMCCQLPPDLHRTTLK